MWINYIYLTFMHLKKIIQILRERKINVKMRFHDIYFTVMHSKEARLGKLTL